LLLLSFCVWFYVQVYVPAAILSWNMCLHEAWNVLVFPGGLAGAQRRLVPFELRLSTHIHLESWSIQIHPHNILSHHFLLPSAITPIYWRPILFVGLYYLSHAMPSSCVIHFAIVRGSCVIYTTNPCRAACFRMSEPLSRVAWLRSAFEKLLPCCVSKQLWYKFHFLSNCLLRCHL
jgi:hypothetical protein